MTCNDGGFGTLVPRGRRATEVVRATGPDLEPPHRVAEETADRPQRVCPHATPNSFPNHSPNGES
jgi:hypothetical protein